MSRRHAELRQEGASYWIVDLGSTNGIEVNGRRVKRAKLSDGDTITLGSTEVTFSPGIGMMVCDSVAVDELLLVLKIAFLVLLYLFIWRIVRTASRDLRLPQESFILAPSGGRRRARVQTGPVTGRPRRRQERAIFEDGEGFELDSRAAHDRPRQPERHPDRDGRVRVGAPRALRAAAGRRLGRRTSARRTARS